jgi:putative colanic acid biosynthesis UDP-glucose lipid carrier transferase
LDPDAKERVIGEAPVSGPVSRALDSDASPPSTISARAYRITPLRPRSVPPPPDEGIAGAVVDILLAAAEADGSVCRRESFAIRRLLLGFLNRNELPEWVEKRIEEFDFAKFSPHDVTRELAHLPAEQKRHVLELARRVCDANDAYDLEEERLMLALVIALELDRGEVDDLVLHTAPGLDGALKRCFDVVFALTFLSLSWPLLGAIVLAIKATSPGPALFAQRRYGKGGREFRVWKFRTMSVLEDGRVVKQATNNDPRITPLGAFLRRTSLDELPQFVNVLLGDMSVVGPRPHAVSHNRLYRTQILEYMLRHKVKPGITGLAQVNGWRGQTDTLDKMVGRVEHDLQYIRSQSLGLDLRIVWQTVFGFTGRNAR